MSELHAWRRGFHLALSRELLYRLNFFLGRVREFVVFGTLLFVFQALPQGSGAYTQPELLSYVLLSTLLSGPLFVYSMHQMANEITEGEFTNYLLRPLSYFGYWSARTLASRALLGGAGIIALAILLLCFRHHTFFWQSNPWGWIQCGILFLGSVVLVQLLDFIAASFSFWMPRAHGPRWMITILIQLLSGSLIPLDLCPVTIKNTLVNLPFAYILYGPIKAWIHPFALPDFLSFLLKQWLWITITYITLLIVWKRGVKLYEAYGR
jgi:ABC-2 type transport system permease protein